MNKGLRRFLALALAGTMVFGCTITAFAEESGENTSGSSVSDTADGSYEGGALKYPTLSVTLPTVVEDEYDYIADPNGLIAATNQEKYGDDVTFSENAQGIFFKTTVESATVYADTSAAKAITNQNAQDIDVTVTLEQEEAGSDIITYSDTNEFEESDTANKVYFALKEYVEDEEVATVEDGEEEDETEGDDTSSETEVQVSALTSSAAAKLEFTVAGNPDNYVADYDTESGYGYVLDVDNADPEWNSCAFVLTGALNTNATWGDEVTFPTLKVTWSYAEASKNEIPTEVSTEATSIDADGGTVTIALPDDVTIDEVLRTSTTSSSGFKALDNSYYSTEYSTNSVELTVNIADKTEYAQIKITFIGSDEVIVLDVEF